MKKRIDSTFYFFQYLFWRISIVYEIIFLAYSLFTKETGGIIFCLLAIFFTVYVSIKKVPKPDDLNFDNDFLYLDKVPYPIAIEKIKAIENDVILYEVDGDIINITLPRYSFIDKNYKELKRVVENRNIASTRKKD